MTLSPLSPPWIEAVPPWSATISPLPILPPLEDVVPSVTSGPRADRPARPPRAPGHGIRRGRPVTPPRGRPHSSPTPQAPPTTREPAPAQVTAPPPRGRGLPNPCATMHDFRRAACDQMLSRLTR
ncbi:hypothetical protein HCN51_48585 [Nonomuraea sp. FMUSA5-5]|uniref:Uncharacterized protein n=1 Tax=Nonomuraea composti TaxID=2720023 RepID=A0ABX1BKU4_9ACTN|nr:hypothetical protein [Nonomuraea sp. FMUSA5-5]NJP97199.1 hypothetical protein [Nonomuraea sp. FMUSA5-5]